MMWTNSCTSIGNAVGSLLQQQTLNNKSEITIQSLAIPRYLFGSSGHDSYSEGLVMDRFTRRFDMDSCLDEENGEQQRRRLFNKKTPISYCKDASRRDSYDFIKSMTLVSSLTHTCIDTNKTDTSRSPFRVLCHGSHHHTLQSDSIKTVNMPKKGQQMMDARKLKKELVGDTLFILHYMTKSRQELYQRTCDSVWSRKYFQCDECSPEFYFNLTELYANNYEDTRMSTFWSVKLKARLKSSAKAIGANCNSVPTIHSWEYYKECFENNK